MHLTIFKQISLQSYKHINDNFISLLDYNPTNLSVYKQRDYQFIRYQHINKRAYEFVIR